MLIRLKMKKIFLYITLFMAVSATSQTVYNVEDCRKMALEHNASIKIAKENVKAARSMKKAAFTHFLPDFSATGAYLWNEKNMSVFPHDLMLPVGVKQPDGSVKSLSVKQVAELLGHTTSEITELYYVKRDTTRLVGLTDSFNL